MKNLKRRIDLLVIVILIFGLPVLSAAAQAPAVTVVQNCSDWGSNGWCHTSADMHISMPGGTVTCWPLACDVWAGNGTWTVNYTGTDNSTGISTSGSVDLKVDTLSPWANIQVPSPTGSNGWFKTTPVVIPFNAYDYFSGLNTVRASSDGGTTWQTWTQSSFTLLGNGTYLTPGLSLSADGQYAIPYTVDDVSGWSRSYPGVTVKIDSTPPVMSPSISGTLGSNSWYTSSVTVTAAGSDTTSGLSPAGATVWSGGAWRTSAVLTLDGKYSLDFRATDNAGNLATVTRIISIDTTPPTINYTVSGTSGSNGWYVSKAVVSATASDFGSGLNTILISDNGEDGKSGPIALSDGIHHLTITATDRAGNSRSVAQTVYVDTTGPSISQSSTGTSGINGWYVSAVNVNATVLDDGSGPQGDVEVSMDNGSTWNAVPVQLSDGLYDLTYRAYDKAGNLSTSSATVNIDTTPPSLDTSIEGESGSSGWFVSQTTTSISANDSLAGLESIEFNQNGTGWQTGTSFMSTDGINSASVRVYDKAGNVTTESTTVKIDTVAPESLVSNQPGTSVASGTIDVYGISSDEISGLQFTEISLDGGTTWNKTSLSGNRWSFDWDTTSVPNGPHTVLVRSEDAAGNLESSVPFVFTLDNLPPHVKVTDWWWIWESGDYRVSPNTFPISTIKVKISDPENRWDPVTVDYSPDKTSAPIEWDRRFPGGIIAPSGNYLVTVTACDMYEKCTSAQGQIKIPFFSIVPPTSTPLPTVTSTVFVTSSTPIPTATPTALVSPTQVLSGPNISGLVVRSKTEPAKPGKDSGIFQLLWIIAFLGLLFIFGTSVVLDHRPEAVYALAQTIQSNMK